jgi:YD repeat-containing protein
VQGSAAVVVSDAGALSLSASRTALTVGETVPVVLALPYPVAQPVTINLSATAGLQVPASMTLAAGETSRTFNAQATAVGAPTLTAATSLSGVAFEPAQLGFSISAAVPSGPVISSVAPNAGAPGTPITLSGSGFASTPSGNSVVFTGHAPAVVQSASATQLVVTVPATAQTGPIAVTTTAGTGQSPVFTVQRDQAFDLQSSPAQLSVMQGSQASAVIQLASSGVRPYEGLARLSITGLPAGITARFEPAQISAQQSGQLILSAADSAALGSSTLTIQAQATLDGLPWIRQSQITAQVITRANVTGVKGRFVTPQGQGIAGVIVRHENSTNQVVTDAAGNFLITGLPSGVSTLRFDATPAHSLYPIWPYSVTLQAGEVLSHRLNYEYDSLDRMTKRNLSGTGITTAETTSYAWDLAGRLLSHTTNIGSTPHKTDYEYDQAGRLAARHAQAGSQGKVTQRYGYDQAERLAQIKYLRNEGQSGEQLIEQIDYSYDAKGQRTAKTTLNNHGTGAQDTPMTATYDAANRMSTVTLNIGGASKSYTLTHDANGNLTTKQNTADSQDKTTYTWDSNNRLTQITQPGLTASFSYDAFGRRIQSSITKGGNTSTVQYLYEGLQALGEIRDGKLSHRLLTGLSVPNSRSIRPFCHGQ